MKTKMILLMVAFAVAVNAKAQEINDLENLLIDEFIKSIESIDKVKTESDDLRKVFRGTFFKVTPIFTLETSVASCGEYSLVVLDEELTMLEELGENKPLEQLFSLLQENFVINNESDALTFEKALDAIYPQSWADKPENKKHFRRDDTWVFTRGEFFESLKGFIVEVDQDGNITNILYDLYAVRN